MDWKFLFTSLDGRIPRKVFWLGIVISVVVAWALGFVISSVFGVNLFGPPEFTEPGAAAAYTQSTAWINVVVFLVMLWPILALMLKRRHDRGSAGYDVYAYLALTAVLLAFQMLGLGYSEVELQGIFMPVPTMATGVISAVVAIMFFYLLVVLGFLKGNEGANVYGPDPLAREESTEA